MPFGTPVPHTPKHRWRKILAPLVIGPAIAAAGLAVSAGSASAQCNVSDGLLSQTPSSERSDSVACLQTTLNERGFHAGPADGWFGPVTTAAVTSFQQANGLTVDGWMGRETRTALGIGRTNAVRSTPARTAAATRPATRRAPAQATTSHRSTQRSSGGATGASGVNWDKVAHCESGGNWSAGLRTNHVGTFSGGLMIMQSAWRQYGGQQFAPSAGQASKAEQIIVAERVAARVGAARAWECPVS